jgi:hypothetical protein
MIYLSHSTEKKGIPVERVGKLQEKLRSKKINKE